MNPPSLYQKIWQDLAAEKAIIFLAGPRQSGKTTLARMISERFATRLYVDWDNPEDRARLRGNPFFFQEIERRGIAEPFIVFDEIHKYRDWKNYLKGVYDRFHRESQFLISRSGRLDVYRKGGDSLAGRYFLFHLWPFTLAVDFRFADENKPFLLIETKLSENQPSPALLKFQTLPKVPAIQLTNRGGGYRKMLNGDQQVLVVPSGQWLSAIP